MRRINDLTIHLNRAFLKDVANPNSSDVMRGLILTNLDSNGRTLIFDLRDIIRILGEKIESSVWRASNVEVVGDAAVEFDKLQVTKEAVSHERFSSLVDKVEQTIDGAFEAYRIGEVLPWLKIRAVDCGAFEIECEDVAILEQVGASELWKAEAI